MLLPEHRPVPLNASDANVQRVRAAYDAAAEKYDANYTHPKDFAENRYVIGRLVKEGFTEEDVVDGGCGTGFLLDETPPAKRWDDTSYVGVDISDGMLDKAKAKYPTHAFRNAPMEDTGLPAAIAGAFVSLFGSFNYVLRAPLGMSEMWRLLAPGGRIFLMICTPRHARRSSYVLRDNAPDRRFYTAAEVRALVGVFFNDVRVTGMSWVVDFLPRWLPQWVFNAVMWLETRTIGRLLPDSCYYLIVTAQKSATVLPFAKR